MAVNIDNQIHEIYLSSVGVSECVCVGGGGKIKKSNGQYMILKTKSTCITCELVLNLKIDI